MIPIKFNPDEFFADGAHAAEKVVWDSLVEKAKAATEEIVKEWELYRLEFLEWQKTRSGDAPKFQPKFDEKVWKGFRDWMEANVFHYKCAYCETNLRQESIPDAEHFRPKREIIYQSAAAKTFDEDGVEVVHPGYFWLAYNWKNLLPSCHVCNRYEGKKSSFPAKSYFLVARLNPVEVDNLTHREIRSLNWQDVYYLQPEDLDAREGRLLLHPFFDNPQDHIFFDVMGKAVAKDNSPEGTASIETFALNQEHKIRYRNEAQKSGFLYIMTRVAAEQGSVDSMRAAAEKALKEYFQGEKPYAAAVYDYLKTMYAPILVPSLDSLLGKKSEETKQVSDR